MDLKESKRMTNYKKYTTSQTKKGKINKADIVIYCLAIISFVLMIVVLTTSRYEDLRLDSDQQISNNTMFEDGMLISETRELETDSLLNNLNDDSINQNNVDESLNNTSAQAEQHPTTVAGTNPNSNNEQLLEEQEQHIAGLLEETLARFSEENASYIDNLLTEETQIAMNDPGETNHQEGVRSSTSTVSSPLTLDSFISLDQHEADELDSEDIENYINQETMVSEATSVTEEETEEVVATISDNSTNIEPSSNHSASTSSTLLVSNDTKPEPETMMDNQEELRLLIGNNYSIPTSSANHRLVSFEVENNHNRELEENTTIRDDFSSRLTPPSPIEEEQEVQQTVSSQTETSTTNTNFISYTVENGDCLWKIALKYNVKTLDIINNNNFRNPDIIYPGQVIQIPVM